MKNKKESFIEKSNKKHNGKYNYSKVEYINSQRKVCIICPEHGEFWQTPVAHVRGHGCPICSNHKRGKHTVNTENLIERCMKIHNNKYSYEKTKYIDANTKICVTCPVHGDFHILPFNHLGGQGCPKCKGRNLTQQEVINKFKEIHSNKYDYSKVIFTKMREKVCIICPEHGEFWQTPQKHINGQGCPICGGRAKLTTPIFIKKSNNIHNFKYIYSNAEYINNKTSVDIICPIHGVFKQLPYNHLKGHGCPKCVETTSKQECVIYNFIKKIDKDIMQSKRDVVFPYELDLYSLKHNIAVEYNGLYWHNEKNVTNNYHLMKTELCEKQGIRLIHIFEDEWLYKQNIVKSRLKSIFGITPNKIYARKCIIKEVSFSDCKIFLDQNHIQGECMSKYRYGLYYNGELVSLMTFGSKRKNLGSNSKKDCYELLRFCNKLNTNVVGGASKLLKHFVKVHNPKEIISYCDRRWSVGNMYEKLGFKLDHVSQPNYYYVINGKRENRFKYRKSELIKQGFNKDKSEHEIMLERGIYRIYDCGTKVYKWKKEDF